MSWYAERTKVDVLWLPLAELLKYSSEPTKPAMTCASVSPERSWLTQYAASPAPACRPKYLSKKPAPGLFTRMVWYSGAVTKKFITVGKTAVMALLSCEVKNGSPEASPGRPRTSRNNALTNAQLSLSSLSTMVTTAWACGPKTALPERLESATLMRRLPVLTPSSRLVTLKLALVCPVG